ncbi:MAG TPA: hypothetical protein DIW30_01070 [Bacteroidales bacterium]|nr:hypothetical protein [Bacteroidales bacterium]
MKLLLLRTNQTEKAIVGSLFCEGRKICDTLELAGIIPLGWYKLQLTYSPKFRRILPLLTFVPGHTAIRIHAGNTLADTKGCILVGTLNEHKQCLHNARTAEQKLVDMLIVLPPYEECYLEIATPRYRAAELECMRHSA